ncbi:phosphonate C-P lyase system protein PhnH [Halegenticoccus soli]|uniref:phosphonate C-P lyase system protein PhnH n=1 Tax=Halegenticoccus soli TaxID=1985678 RepID=UPI000C6E2B91|nr:phosphonate C-P lyase system protein PhnH [Halegenticoccus soli]
MRALGMDPVHDARATFRALVDAMSRPGTVRRVPAGPADRAALATLVDHEVTCYTPDEEVRGLLAREGRLAEAPFERARIVHAPEPTDGRVRDANRGTLREPSEGATVIYRVASLNAPEVPSEGGGDPVRDTRISLAEGDGGATGDPDGEGGCRVTVSGPGVPGTRRLSVGGLPPTELSAVADAQSGYPRGIDVVLAAADRVAALPRSATLEVV